MTTEIPVAVPYSSAPQVPPRSTRLGLVAMLIGIGVFVLSLLASVGMGIAAAPYAVNEGGNVSVMLSGNSGDPRETLLTFLALAHGGLGTLLGVWALVQGIIAIATRRGRTFGIVAVIVAFLAPGLSMITYFGIALSLAS